VAGYQRNRSCGYCKTSDGSMQIPPHSTALTFLFLIHRRQRHCPDFVNMLVVQLAHIRLITVVQRFVILHLERQVENRPLSGTRGQGLETVGSLHSGKSKTGQVTDPPPCTAPVLHTTNQTCYDHAVHIIPSGTGHSTERFDELTFLPGSTVRPLRRREIKGRFFTVGIASYSA
jgi:hypothetical protein